MWQTMKLCTPCAEKMKDSYTVTPYGGTSKISCDWCGRRRFGKTHDVTKKIKK